MSGKWQKNQLELAFMAEGRGEASTSEPKGSEPPVARNETESPTREQPVMEEIVERENLLQALKRVKAKKGGPGHDGMTVNELSGYLTKVWPELRAQMLNGTYQPQPVKRVRIPKPDGGERELGIPTVLDRFMQQAVMQVLQRYWDPTFSERSYGFRPKRSAHQAVAQAQGFITEGYDWVVDLDLEKFFDRVNHDRLMSVIAKRVEDKRILKLIRAYLNAGVMENGMVSVTNEGTPQGGPLSPLLSNLVLDELDKELEERGHRFVRYADDCNIYVKSERAGQRVMESVKHFIGRRLKLRVNEQKSAVARPAERKFLGFSFTSGPEPKRRIAPKSLERFKSRIRELTNRNRGRSLGQVTEELSEYLRGWRGYYGFCQTPSVLAKLESWIRRRLRCLIWKQWKTGKNRKAELMKRGLPESLAKPTAWSSKGLWRVSRCQPLQMVLTNAYFDSIGIPRLLPKRP